MTFNPRVYENSKIKAAAAGYDRGIEERGASRLIDVSGKPVDPPTGALAMLRECGERAMRRCDLGTPAPPGGSVELREALGTALGCAGDSVVITAGVRAAVPILKCFFTEVVVERPSFSGVADLADDLGMRVVRRPWHDMIADSAPAVWITHPARNPDGASLSAEQITALAPREGITVVNEVYRWHKIGHAQGEPELPGHWFVVGSLSKVFGPAARLGWLRGERTGEIGNHVLRIGSPPLVVQEMWADFLNCGGLRLLAAAACEQTAVRRVFCDAVGMHAAALTGDGPSILVPTPSGWTADEALIALEDRGIRASSGTHFGAGSGMLRFTFTGVSQQEALLVAEDYLGLKHHLHRNGY